MTYEADQIRKNLEALESNHAAEIKKMNEALNVGSINRNMLPIKHGNVYRRTNKAGLREIPYVSLEDNDSIKFDLTDEGLAKFKTFIENRRIENETNNAKNKKIHESNLAVIDAIKTIMIRAGFKEKSFKNVASSRSRKSKMEWVDSDWVLALKSELPIAPRYDSFWAARAVKTFIEILESHKKVIEDKKKEDEAKILSNPLTVKAIEYLVNKGKKLDVDFNALNAIELANSIAFDEAVSKKMAIGGPFSFCGDSTCEDCNGWDGESHRCYCGNRRVQWVETFDCNFTNMDVYGEAY